MKTIHPTRRSEIRASDLMKSPVQCVYIEDTVDQVASLFVSRGISAAPVIGNSGTPVGVITKSDLARYDSERLRFMSSSRDPGRFRRLRSQFLEIHPGFHLEPAGETIREWITLNIEAVYPDTALSEILRKMLRSRIHHVFVKSKKGDKVIGVITTFDLTRYLSRMLRTPKRARAVLPR